MKSIVKNLSPRQNLFWKLFKKELFVKKKKF